MDETTQRMAPTRDAQRSPTRITTLSNFVCPCVWNCCPRRTDAYDLTVRCTKPGKLSKSWDNSFEQSWIGNETKQVHNLETARPWNSEPVIPGIKVDSGLIVLGSPAVDGSEMPLGAPKLDESNLANDPTTVRANKACKLATGITDMAHAMVDKCGAHAATVLLQRVVCPSLDYDLRARADKHVATQQRRVHDAVFQSLAAITRRELGPEQQSQIALSADMGGCAIRSPNRKGAGVAARWAALTLPRAQRALEELGYCGCWKQAQQELEDVTSELCNFGVGVCDGTPVVDPHLHDVIASCPPANCAQQHAALTPSPTNHARSRLQGKAGKAIDIVTLSRLWKHLSSNAKETIQSVAGPGTGLLWSDCSRDERNGWLQDHHFQQALLNRLSLPRVAPGSICALAPQSGERKGQLCGMPLDSFGRHSHGACRAAGTRTRVPPRDPPLCCQLLPKSGTERGGRSRDPRTARESSRWNRERSPAQDRASSNSCRGKQR